MTLTASQKCYEIIDQASRVRSSDYIGLQGREEFNAAAIHASELIFSAAVLLNDGHHAPALFLAITSFEEIAKIKAGHMRGWGQQVEEVKRGKDPLFSHTDKHKIALDPIVLIGNRLANTIGQQRVEEIFEGYADGTSSTLRESSLYFSRDKTSLKIPSVEICPKLTVEHILVAIELYADFFYFMTQAVSEACERLDVLFEEMAELYRAS